MHGALFPLTALAVAAVAGVLVFGMWNMSRGGSPETSQKLMRWRVGLQFFALMFLLLALLLAGKG